MHLLEAFQIEIVTKFPDAGTTIDRPLRSDGVWVLDLVRGDQRYVIEWFADDRIGLSKIVPGDADYGTGPDEILTSIEALRTKLEAAIA